MLPLTEDRPKCLLEVGPRTMLEHQLQALRMCGVTSIEIVTGHGAERVEETCDGLATYVHNADYARTNSFDSLGCATIEFGPEGLLVLNSDVVFHPELLKRLLDDPRENVLLADFDVAMGEEETKIVVDEQHRILQISKALDPAKAHAENLGIVRFGPAAARSIIKLGADRDRDPGMLWVPDGIHHLRDEFEFYALGAEGSPWIEVDYVHDLERAREVVYPRIHEVLWESE